MKIAFIQIENEGGGYENAPYEKAEVHCTGTFKEALTAIATILNRTIRVTYPNSNTDTPNNMSGSYISPKIKLPYPS